MEKSKKQKQFDELIHEALSREEAEFYDQLEEDSIRETVTSLLKGKYRWLNAAMVIVSFAIMAAGVYSIIQFFNSTDVKMLITWSGAFFLCMAAIGAMKIWAWMQFDKHDLMREIKRLELQVSVLANKVASDKID